MKIASVNYIKPTIQKFGQKEALTPAQEYSIDCFNRTSPVGQTGVPYFYETCQDPALKKTMDSVESVGLRNALKGTGSVHIRAIAQMTKESEILKNILSGKAEIFANKINDNGHVVDKIPLSNLSGKKGRDFCSEVEKIYNMSKTFELLTKYALGCEDYYFKELREGKFVLPKNAEIPEFDYSAKFQNNGSKKEHEFSKKGIEYHFLPESFSNIKKEDKGANTIEFVYRVRN